MERHDTAIVIVSRKYQALLHNARRHIVIVLHCYTRQSEVWSKCFRLVGSPRFQRVSSVAQVSSLQVHRSSTRACRAAILAATRFGACSHIKPLAFPAIISMSGQEDILDGLEVNLQRSRQIFPFLQHLTPYRRSAYRATPKHSNHYLR